MNRFPARFSETLTETAAGSSLATGSSSPMAAGRPAPARSRCRLLALSFWLLAAGAAPAEEEAHEGARIEATIERLDADSGADDASLATARALLAATAERRTRIDRHVARAAEVETTIAALELDIAAARLAVRAAESAASAGTEGRVESSPEGAARSTITLRDERDAIDVRLTRSRRELDSLERRGPAILRALEAVREEALVPEEGEAGRIGATLTGAAASADVLEAARRYERAAAVEALRRELGTIAPRARVAAARLRLLELRRGALEVVLERRVMREDASLVAGAAARREALEAQIAAIGDEGPGAAARRAALALRLGHAHLVEDLARRGVALRRDETALRQTRRDLVSAESGARAALASGTLNDAQGALLLRLRRELPDPDALTTSLNAAAREAERLRARRVLWEDELRRLEAGEAPMESSDALRRLIDVARRHAERIERHALALGDTRERAALLGTLLDRRLLWLRRGESLAGSLPRDVLVGVRWLADPFLWSDALSTYVEAVSARPYRSALIVLFALGLLGLRRRLLALQADLAARVGHVGRDGYRVTPQAIALVVPLALPVPLAVAAGGWPLASVTSGFPRSLGIALVAVASVMFALSLFRRLSRRGGVFVTHFGWSETAASDLERSLRRLGQLQIPMTFLLSLTLSGPETRYGLGLIAFTVISLALGAFVWRVCRPRTGVLALAASSARSTLATRLGAIVLVAVPVVVGLLPLAGYLDAALALQERVFRSALVLLSGAVVYGLLMRLYSVSLRRYSLRWARERRAERARSRDAAQSGEVMPGAATTELLAPEPLAGQARVALLAFAVITVAAGLWWLWSPLLPALGVIDEIVLWERRAIVDGTAEVTPVTLWSLVLALSLFVGGLLAARNLRGLLQVGVLQRLDVDPGTRYAIVTIAGYVALGAGLVGGLAQLGIDWSKLQWIVAALGVGLGFGLQEIVANFVSGLIILFERPVRVGDVVTIGQLSGTVSDIRIRATTVTDFENREVLLPNKAIITENVTNWTLRDATTRLLLKIGVAYGSDVEEVRTLLLDIVHSHPDVLSVPAPSVFFVAHGASSLDFELRVFVASTAERLPTTHELNASINARLAAADITIPFPQADVTVHLPERAERLGLGHEVPDEGRRAA